MSKFIGFAVSLVAFVGCTSVDCHRICARYADCFDEDYDVAACRQSCEADADKDDDYAKKVEDCESCIDDRACSEAIFPCADECIGIVP